MEKKIGIIGFGHMGQAIAHALIGKGWKIVASDRESPKNHPYLRSHRNCCEGKISLLGSNLDVLQGVPVCILAVRPFQMKDILNEIMKNKSGNTPLLISIAAGIPISFLKKNSGTKKIARVMPNLPVQIGQGMSVWKSIGLNMKEKNLVKDILQSFGVEIEISDENLIDAATAVSGSGPGYVFAFLDALQKSAEKLGFPKDQARILALQTILGSAVFAKNSEENFDVLASQVQTKGGTTEAAFKILKKGKWAETLKKATYRAFIQAKKLVGK